MIPPSSNIVAALGAFTALYPETEITTGQFWIILWGCAIWFIIQRILMVFGFCKYYKVKPMDKSELPKFREVLKKGWKALFIPVVILVPFLLDYMFKDNFFTERLGEEGAKFFSSSLLLFVAGVAAIYACLIVKDKKTVKFPKISVKRT